MSRRWVVLARCWSRDFGILVGDCHRQLKIQLKWGRQNWREIAFNTDGERKCGPFEHGKKALLRRFTLAGVMPQQAAEALLALNFADGQRVGWMRVGFGEWAVVERLVRALCVVKINMLADDVPKMLFAEDNEMIEALLFDRQNPAFREGIQIRGARADLAQESGAHMADFRRIKRRN